MRKVHTDIAAVLVAPPTGVVRYKPMYEVRSSGRNLRGVAG